MVIKSLPDFLGPDPDPCWYTPKGKAVLKRLRNLASTLNLDEDELATLMFEEYEEAFHKVRSSGLTVGLDKKDVLILVMEAVQEGRRQAGGDMTAN